MEIAELLKALKQSSIDKHRCLGCGYEHNCGVHGCVINRRAIEIITELEGKLELATAKKPRWLYEDEPLCPCCGEVLDTTEEHCDGCDQRLDWSGI